MLKDYARDLDLNLLRVFAAVVQTGSVTKAAEQLYLTQPAVSAAIRRLATSLDVPLFARRGRHLVLTARGSSLYAAIQMHLQPLVQAALDPGEFQPAISEKVWRLGLSDGAEMWLLPGLIQVLRKDAPRMSVVVVPVHFRNIRDAFATGLDLAIAVADELPSDIQRSELNRGEFVCLVDDRHCGEQRWSEKEYFAREHVIVSYNGDLRGIVEDAGRKARRVRCAVSHFWGLGELIEGTDLVATVPSIVAQRLTERHRHLRTRPVPFKLPVSPMELLWSRTLDDDPHNSFLRQVIVRLAQRRS